MTKEHDIVRQRLHHAEADLKVTVDILGDLIAKEQNYDDGGMEAIVLHLVEKHHWLPSDIRAMNSEDLRLVLSSDFKRLGAKLASRLKAISHTTSG